MSYSTLSRSCAVFSFRLFAFAFFLGLSGLSACMCDLNGPECRHNRDCPTAAICHAGWCRPEGEIVCQHDGSCPQGMRCSQGVCAPSAVSCKTNQDCPSTQECRALVCQPQTPPACTKDADCPTTQTCQNGTCAPVTLTCSKDSDCETGYRCKQGACLSAAELCKEDSDCQAGRICVFGICLPAGTCLPSKLSHTTATNVPFQMQEIFVRKGGAEILDVSEAALRSRDLKAGEWTRWWSFPTHETTSAVALSPSERWLARAAAEIALWDLESEGPPQAVLPLKVSALHLTDQTLSVLEKGRLARYSIPDLRLQNEVPFSADIAKQTFLSSAFDPKGATFAFATLEGTEGRVTVVEAATMKILHTLSAPKELPSYSTSTLGFSPTGRYLWALGSQGLLVWDLNTPSPPTLLVLPAVRASQTPLMSPLAFHPKETHLVVAQADGIFRWFALPGASEITKNPVNLKGVKILRFSPDGLRLYAVTEKEDIYALYDDGRFLSDPFPFRPKPFPLSMASPRDQPGVVRSTTADGVIREWDLDARTFQARIIPSQGKETKYRDVVLSPDGRFALDFFSKQNASGTFADVFEQWEFEPTFRKLREFTSPSQGLFHAPRAFSPDGRFLAVPLPERKVGLWDLHTGEALPLLDATPILPTSTKASISVLAISPGASYVVATGLRERPSALWNRREGTSLSLSTPQGKPFDEFLFALDGETFAARTGLESVEIFSSKTGLKKRSIPIPPFPSSIRLAFSPNGALLALATSKLISFFDIETGKSVLTYSLGSTPTGSPNLASLLFFSSSGQRFFYATGGEFSAWDCP